MNDASVLDSYNNGTLRRRSSKASEMYLRKIRPRTTCLYSAASMLLRSLSAASQSLASKPMLAEELEDDLLDLAIEARKIAESGRRMK